MSQPPPPDAPPTETYTPPYYGRPLVPLPAISGELIVFLVVWLVAAIVALATDAVNARHCLTASVALAIGYMLSRGLAKAGRVLEDR